MAAELARRACLRPGARQRFEQAVALAGRAVLAESELGRRDALAQLLPDLRHLQRQAAGVELVGDDVEAFHIVEKCQDSF